MAAAFSVALYFGLLSSFLFSRSSGTVSEYTFTGTHFAFGEYLGTTFSAEIASIVANYGFYSGDMVTWSGSNSASITAWITYVTTNYPDISQEIYGMASGSGVSNDTIWLLNFEAEIKAALGASPVSSTGTENVELSEGTGTIYISDSYHTFQVDNDLEFQNKGFIMKATIEDDIGNVLENFVALMYPGFLAGGLAYKNRHNIFASVNHVYSQHTVGTTDTIPTAIALRDVMRATDISNAQTLVTQGSGMATSAVINFHQNNQYSSLEVRNNNTISTSLLDFSSGSTMVFNYNAFNQFSMTDSYNTLASIYRAGVLISYLYLPKLASIAEVETLLSNTLNTQYPIYRDPGTFSYGTLYSVIYDVCNGTLHVYDSEPSSATPVSVNLITRAI